MSGNVLMLIPKKVMALQLEYSKLEQHVKDLAVLIPQIRQAWLSIEKPCAYYGQLSLMLEKLELDEKNSLKCLLEVETQMFHIVNQYSELLERE